MFDAIKIPVLYTFSPSPPAHQTFHFVTIFALFYIINQLFNLPSAVPFAHKLIFPTYNQKSAFAAFLLQYCVFYKIKKLLKQAVLTHHKQISRLTSKCWPGGLFCNFSLDVKLSNGGNPLLPNNTEKSIWIACLW